VLLAACTHAQKPPGPERRIELDPIVVTAGRPQEIRVDEKTEAQLFDDGSLLFRAERWADAAVHFDRLFSAFPRSPHFDAALFNAGLSHERLGRFREALDRFEALIARGAEVVDATFHAALAEYRLGRVAAAAERLLALAARPGLPAERKAEALVQQAVCRFDLGARSEAERLLRAALALLEKAEPDPSLPAQAEFWIGEVYRSYFRDAALDPAAMDEKQLGDAMESKAQFLLSAQGHYLRAIRKGQGEWATAAGFRIGELYEAFHDQLVDAPLPRGLDPEQAALYREELRKKVRVLISKAIQIYDQTLATAVRVGATNDYVERTRASLERLRKLLIEPAL